MSIVRYDLTPKVAPFLDSALLKKVEEFNGNTSSAGTSADSSAPAFSEPNLQNAETLYNSGKFLEAYKMLSSLKFSAGSPEEEPHLWGLFAAALMAFPDPPKVETKTESKEEENEEEGADSEAASTPSAEPEQSNHADPVMDAMSQVQSLLDQRRGADSTMQLNRRAWLIHWSLFVYFNGRLPKLVDTIFSSQNMSVIQAACPWILRYVVIAAVVTHSRTARFDRRIKDMIRVVQQELYEYSDPVLDFVQCLYVDYDFASVSEKLEAALKTVSNDYFAHQLVPKFEDSARVLIADTILRVHDFLPISTLEKNLGLKDNSKWVSEYITSKQEAKLDASIDMEKGVVRVNYSKPSINSQVSDKVKGMDQKAHLLQQAYKKTEA